MGPGKEEWRQTTKKEEGAMATSEEEMFARFH